MSFSSQPPGGKYHPIAPIDLPDRQWPTKQTTKAPIWCSVDLRDGNQALIEPMGHERKRQMFEALVDMGFKEIEVGFPAASQTDFDFVRWLIDNHKIPDDVTIQVLVQCREDLINRTFEAIKDARAAIVHFYNSTSTLQRRVVFGLDTDGIIDIAVNGARWCREGAMRVPETKVRFEYSPESFTGTELPFAKDICEAVMAEIGATAESPVILNLPATVEMASPNHYADQIEWFHRNVGPRAHYILSLHPHNDRGTGVGAAELALLAGADRIEGTLFGNGERCGNVDVVTLALNLFTQGIDPALDLSNINSLVQTAEYCNQLPIHPRHPYAGELVYTSFSGSHQDAIKKGFAAMEIANDRSWAVPYLPIDPKDVGRSYEAVIRVNSQSGKGGVAFLLERDYGVKPPRRMLIEFSRIVQARAERDEAEVEAAVIWEEFKSAYLKDGTPARLAPLVTLTDYQLVKSGSDHDRFEVEAQLTIAGKPAQTSGTGTGPIDAFVHGLGEALGLSLEVCEYKEHALQAGADSRAMAYVELKEASRQAFGAGRSRDIITASLEAVISAVNRLSVDK
ncbi:MAG: 2-isopropylmalate synthase [Pseudomonadota bacterium]